MLILIVVKNKWRQDDKVQSMATSIRASIH